MRGITRALIGGCWRLFAAGFVALAILLTSVSALAATHISTRIDFDHDKTLFPLTGLHQDVKCEDCHVRGVFKGTSRDCAGCHNSGFLPNNVGKSPTHVPTQQNCDKCHTTIGWIQSAVFNHVGVQPGTCAQCHNGATAEGKTATHIVTTQSCDVCHKSTLAWKPAGFDHSTVTPPVAGRCSDCHNGVNATAKPSNHIATLASDQCDVCHNTRAWIPAGFNHQAEGVTVGGHACASCHDGVRALGKPAKHIPTTAACDVCHTSFTNFFLSTFDHAAAGLTLSSTCSNCHDGSHALGMPATHITTQVVGGGKLECGACHKTGLPLQVSSFIGATMDHALMNIKTGCAQCHDNTHATGKPSGHIPTTATCELCHDAGVPNFVAWSGAKMNHATAAKGSCVTCHNGKFAKGMTVSTHIPTALSCDACHNTTDWTVMASPYPHPGVVSGTCNTCHNGQYATVKSSAAYANHVAVTVSCDACHTAQNTKAWISFANGTMNHAGVVAGSCGNCHNDTLAKGINTDPNGRHIPTGAACDTCHTKTSNFTTWAGALMSHNGISPGTCNTCHLSPSQYAYSTPAPALKLDSAYPNHIPFSSKQCDLCHTTGFTSFAGSGMNHAALGIAVGSGGCSNCHNNTLAKGMGSYTNHVATSLQCDKCHLSPQTFAFTSWAGGGFDHAASGISLGNGGCSTCHDGTKAKGISAYTNHISAASMKSAQCDACHTAGGFSTFAGGVMNHAALPLSIGGGTCATCHNGTQAKGISAYANHITTASMGTAQCDVCHTVGGFTSFAGGQMDHTASGLASIIACSTCHNGTKAKGIAAYATHITAASMGTSQCGDCHTVGGYSTFAGGIMNHAAVSAAIHNPAGSGTGQGSCLACHDNTHAVGKASYTSHVATAAQCDACHTSLLSWASASAAAVHTANHVVFGTTNCASCHNGSVGGATGSTAYANHVPVGARLCTACHQAANTQSYTSWAGGSYPHDNSAPNNCLSCHDGTTATGTSAYAKHVVVTGVQCDQCHTSAYTANYSKWGPGTPMKHTATGLAAVANNCQGCHDGNKAIGSSSFASHVTYTGSCDQCHVSTSTKSYTAWIGGLYHSSQGTSYASAAIGSKTCASCHSGAYTTSGAQTMANYANHVAVGGANCDDCHTSTKIWGPGTPMNHTAAGAVFGAGGCSTCHNGVKAMGKSSFTGHVVTTAECDTCHRAANTQSFTSWAGGGFDHAGAGITIGNHSCSTCHDGSQATGISSYANHITKVSWGSANCDSCHTSGFSTWAGGVMNHAAVPLSIGGGNCSGCHNGTQAKGISAYANHISAGSMGTSQCDACHVVGGFTSFAGGQMNHTATGLASIAACSTCHNNTQAKGIAAYTKHIIASSMGTAQCDACHTAGGYSTFAGGIMNHTAVSAVLNNFAGSGLGQGSCLGCHDNTHAVGKASYTTHVATTAQCDTCHTSLVSWASASAVAVHTTNHVVFGTTNCGTCHNGSTGGATGIAAYANHVPVGTHLCTDCHKAANTQSYTSWVGGAYPHDSSAPNNCLSCHNGTTATGTAAYAKHVVVTGVQCDQCHTSAYTANYSQWGPGTPMNHTATGLAAVAGKCQSCHDGNKATGSAAFSNHLTYTGSCDACHVSTTTKAYKDWTGGLYHSSHAGVTYASSVVGSGTCNTCHTGATYATSGALTTTSHPNHVAIGSAKCDACHTSTVTWGPGAPMNHTAAGLAAVAGNCQSCHNGTLAQGISSFSGHMTVTGSCDVCHKASNTISYASWAGGKYHAYNTVAAGGCVACHNGTYKSSGAQSTSDFSGHVVTAASCDTCHTSASTKAFVSFAGGTFSHSPVPTGLCLTCHNGVQAYGMASAGMPAPHIPATGSCDTCHKTVNFTGAFPTGWQPGKYHANNSAAAGSCANCHSGTYSVNGTILGTTSFANHIPTGTSSCEVCHTNTSGYTKWGPGTLMVHSSTAAACTTCHGTAQYKTSAGPSGMMSTADDPTAHIAIGTQDCGVCHSTSTWLGAVYKHTGVTVGAHASNCNTCHNGSTATGSTSFAKHIPYGAAYCDYCHTSAATAAFTSFSGGFLSHTASIPGVTITSNCISCHNGTNATGQPTGHVSTSSQCDVCHTPTNTSNFANWLGAGFNHASASPAVAGRCQQCHDGVQATGTNAYAANHVPVTGVSCDTCHQASLASYGSFSGGVMNHLATGLTVTAKCATCHGVTTYGSYTTYMTGTTISAKGGNAKGLTLHIPVTAASCDTCHTSTSNWDVYTFAHTGIATNPCSTCHKQNAASPYATFGTTAGGAQSTTYITNHIPYWSSGVVAADCSSCHSSMVIPSGWATEKMVASHGGAGTAIVCTACHASGANYMGNMSKKGVTHDASKYWPSGSATGVPGTPVTDCDNCHKPGTGSDSNPGGKTTTGHGSAFSSW